MKNYKKRTLNICLAYLKNNNCKNKRNLLLCLRAWSKGTMEPYAYNISSKEMFKLDVFYTCDRMNSGRAKALLIGWEFA